jgi:DinB superfamily
VAPSETCEQCGFRWSAVSANEIPDRLTFATESFVDVINEAGPHGKVRPSPERWSILEYGAHLRDVFISIRERIITASIEDEPTGAPIHRDERVSLGFYKLDSPSDVAGELRATSELFVRTFRALPPDFERRLFTYSPLTPTTVTILWAGAQAVHECEHHLSDVRENLARVAP